MPPTVNRRNERERNRVKQVNQGFALLRSHIPSLANTKKLSKVITLRSAVDYIKTLERLLDDGENTEYPSAHQYTEGYSCANQGSPLMETDSSSSSSSVDIQLFADQWHEWR